MNKLSTLTDTQVVGLVRTDDKELFAEIMTRYQKRLLRYANYLLSDSSHADDAVQQGFIKAYINLQSFDTKKKFSSWLYRIVHNEAMNIVKKNKPVADIMTQFSLTTNENVEDDYARRELSSLTHNCLAKIPLLYREPLTLYFIEDYSYKEISDILRIPTSTVGVRLSRGKKYLKEICQKQT